MAIIKQSKIQRRNLAVTGRRNLSNENARLVMEIQRRNMAVTGTKQFLFFYFTLYIFKNYTSYLIIHKLIKKCICHSLFSKGKELDVDKERSGKVSTFKDS
jgi:hypothetical protein